jgi:hypothetical protein
MQGRRIIFSIVVILSLGLFCWLSLVDYTVVIGDDKFTLKMSAVLIPAIMILGLVGLLLDRAWKGRLMFGIGWLLEGGFPPLGRAMKNLREWYKPEPPQHLINEYIERGGLNSDLEQRKPFAKWMITAVTSVYENNVQGWAYVGAALLIVIIGFRGIKWIPKNEPTLLLFGLWLEFSLLVLLGIVTFYKPQRIESKGGSGDGNSGAEVKAELGRVKAKLRRYEEAFRKLGPNLKGFVDDVV